MGYDDFWGGSFWSDSYWADSYWAKYGTPAVGGDSARYYYMTPKIKRKNRKDLLLAIKSLLIALKGD